MRKPIDLNSLISSYQDLSTDAYEKFKLFFDFSIKDVEVEQISQFLNNLNIRNNYFNYFYVGYNIPQMGEEFDLLRFGNNYILNLEIKSRFVDDKPRKQLLRNKYYLSSLGKNLELFTYISEENKLYKLTVNDKLIEVSFSVFEEILIKQELKRYSNIDDLFNPSDYLVSPFNNTEKFINGFYFLTQEQSRFKKEILDNPSKHTIIEGLPGTGKTLLLYDIAKHYKSMFNIVIIHTGLLNDGHNMLIKEYDWKIIPVKNYFLIKDLAPDVILIDETQRMKPDQLTSIVKYAISKNIKCIFSIDPKQILSIREHNYRNLERLKTLENKQVFRLSKKIRTNKELAIFLKGLFRLDRMHQCEDTDNISIHYFNNINQAKGFASGLEKEEWTIIDYTEQQYRNKVIKKMILESELNAHRVVGQEFDKVIVLVGPDFYYDINNKLSIDGANHYDPERMLYQSVTRARKKLMLLVYDNKEFMNKLITSFR